jgi:hypothetical protein
MVGTNDIIFCCLAGLRGGYMEEEEGVNCDIEKSDRVVFEKLLPMWHVLDFRCASAIVQEPG